MPCVADRVVDQVAERLFDPDPIAAEGEFWRRVGLESQACILGAPAVAAADRLEQRGGRQRLDLERQCSLLGLRDEQQVFCQLREPVGFFGGGAKRLAQLVFRFAVTEGELELGAKEGERGT